jgi:threonine/homoserine/homoserine lactone efflux protein
MYWNEFLTIAIAHFFAVASPGPDFAIVTRQCVRNGTKAGVWTSLGVGFGILLHVSYCILGVAFFLSQSPFLFNTVKYLATGYLFFLGCQSIKSFWVHKGGINNEDSGSEQNFRKAFVLGFLTNGLNPKATLFFLALFTVVISESTPTEVQVIYGFYLAIATFIWFGLLSNLLGSDSVRLKLLKSGKYFELGMGIVLVLLALQIVLTFDGFNADGD